MPTLKNVRLSMHTLELLSFPHDRVRIVLNRATDKVGLKQREVEGALEQKVRHELPLDRAVPLAVNRGTPVVLADAGLRLLARDARARALARPAGARRRPARRPLGPVSGGVAMGLHDRISDDGNGNGRRQRRRPRRRPPHARAADRPDGQAERSTRTPS